MKVSVCMITLNAADTLDRCLRSVDFADEIVVRDHGSTDGTLDICRRHGARVVQGDWHGFGHAKSAAVAMAVNPWVLSLDSDEEVSPDLARAIRDLPDDPPEAAFELDRISRFLGRWMKHCGWYPDWIIRLFDSRRATFNIKSVHEGVETSGPVGRLDGKLRHYAYSSIDQYMRKLNHYTTLGAEEAFRAGRRSHPIVALIRAKFRFVKVVLLQGALLDGLHGLLLASGMSVTVFVKYLKIWQLGRRTLGEK